MRCPYQEIRYITKFHDEEEHTKEIVEFGFCHFKQCPYFATNSNGGWCRRVSNEDGTCGYMEVK